MFDDIKYFGIDHLEIDFLPTTIEYCKSLDIDNSNYGYTEIQMHGKTYHLWYMAFNPSGYWPSYQFSIALHDRPVPLFAIMYGTKKADIESKSKIVFYSWFFVVTQNGMLPFTMFEFIEKYFPRIQTPWNLAPRNYEIKRLDIALDLALPLPDILAKFDKITKFHAWIWIDKTYEDHHQTYYTADTKKTQNRYKLIRIYDKILDSFTKKKTWLFPHLHTNEEIRRVELELRKHACEALTFTLEELLQDAHTCLSRVFRSHLSSYSTFFQKEIENLHSTRYSLDPQDLKNYYLSHNHLPIDYAKTFLWYTRKIVDAIGEKNLLQLLRENGIIHRSCYIKNSTRAWRLKKDAQHVFRHTPLRKS